MLGAAFFHMMPEAVRLGSPSTLSWAAVGLLALIMIAFIVTGVGTPGGGLVGGPGTDVANGFQGTDHCDAERVRACES